MLTVINIITRFLITERKIMKTSSIIKNDGSNNNNDLIEWQNGRLEKNEILTGAKNWSGIYAKITFIESYNHYTIKNLN